MGGFCLAFFNVKGNVNGKGNGKILVLYSTIPIPTLWREQTQRKCSPDSTVHIVSPSPEWKVSLNSLRSAAKLSLPLPVSCQFPFKRSSSSAPLYANPSAGRSALRSARGIGLYGTPKRDSSSAKGRSHRFVR